MVYDYTYDVVCAYILDSISINIFKLQVQNVSNVG